jgi:glycosyltransferase involved in cell wall biosynthesis
MSTKQLEDWMIPPPVAPVPDGVHRPLWSVMIPTYNCAKYLRQTLESVLSQDLGPEHMQIEVIDDCSTNDDPEAVVRELGNGRVSFFRKPKNEGAIPNFNTCIDRSRGHLLHILHGDDWVLPGFYTICAEKLNERVDIGLLISRAIIVNETGELDSLSDRLLTLELGSNSAEFMYYSNPVRTPCVVMRRSIYEQIGGYLPNLVHVADWEMWIRGIESTGGLSLNVPLVFYRFYPSNDSGRLARTSDNIRDYQRLFNLLTITRPRFNEIRFKKMIISNIKGQFWQFYHNNEPDAAYANLNLLSQVSLIQAKKIQVRMILVDVKTSIKLVLKRIMEGK